MNLHEEHYLLIRRAVTTKMVYDRKAAHFSSLGSERASRSKEIVICM